MRTADLHDKRTIWFLFVTSVWLLVALSAWNMVSHMLRPDTVPNAYPGGYRFCVLLAPVVLTALALFLRFAMFRYPRHLARMFAGVVGAYILLTIVLVDNLVAHFYDRDASVILLCLYFFCGCGHLAFAIFGTERQY